MHNHSHSRQPWGKEKKVPLGSFASLSLSLFFSFALFIRAGLHRQIVNDLGSEIAAGFCLSLFKKGVGRELSVTTF